MRYSINIANLVNKLMPTYLFGRQINLLAQSMLQPLQCVNDNFVQWGAETRLEALMTSQIILFEPFLTKKMKPYFLNQDDTITISDREVLGTPLYYEDAHVEANTQFAIYHDNEGKKKAPLYYESEKFDRPNYSFVVWSPAVNTEKITETEYLSILKFWIEKYMISGKTYNIQYK